MTVRIDLVERGLEKILDSTNFWLNPTRFSIYPVRKALSTESVQRWADLQGAREHRRIYIEPTKTDGSAERL